LAQAAHEHIAAQDIRLPELFPAAFFVTRRMRVRCCAKIWQIQKFFVKYLNICALKIIFVENCKKSDA